MTDQVETQVQCPYCFEVVTILLDPSSRGEMVQDCEVCCNPWSLRVSWPGSRDEAPRVEVERL